MSKVPALNLTVLPFHLTDDQLTAKPNADGALPWEIELTKQSVDRKPPSMTEEEYTERFERLIPAGATVYLGHPVNSDANEHSIFVDEHGPVTAWKFPLFIYSDDRYFLLFTSAMNGVVEHGGGDKQELRVLKQRCEMIRTEYGSVYALDLAQEAKGVLTIGTTTILFEMEYPFDHLRLEQLLEGDVIPPINRDRLEAKRQREAAKKAETQAAEEAALQAHEAVVTETAIRAEIQKRLDEIELLKAKLFSETLTGKTDTPSDKAANAAAPAQPPIADGPPPAPEQVG